MKEKSSFSVPCFLFSVHRFRNGGTVGAQPRQAFGFPEVSWYRLSWRRGRGLVNGEPGTDYEREEFILSSLFSVLCSPVPERGDGGGSAPSGLRLPRSLLVPAVVEEGTGTGERGTGNGL